MFFSLRRHGGHQSSRLAEEEAELKAERGGNLLHSLSRPPMNVPTSFTVYQFHSFLLVGHADFQQQIERDIEMQRKKQQQREKKPERPLLEALPGRRRPGVGRPKAGGISFQSDALNEVTSVQTGISNGEKTVKAEISDAGSEGVPLEEEDARGAEKLQSLRDRMRAAICKAEFGQSKASSDTNRIDPKSEEKNMPVIAVGTDIKTKEERNF